MHIKATILHITAMVLHITSSLRRYGTLSIASGVAFGWTWCTMSRGPEGQGDTNQNEPKNNPLVGGPLTVPCPCDPRGPCYACCNKSLIPFRSHCPTHTCFLHPKWRMYIKKKGISICVWFIIYYIHIMISFARVKSSNCIVYLEKYGKNTKLSRHSQNVEPSRRRSFAFPKTAIHPGPRDVMISIETSSEILKCNKEVIRIKFSDWHSFVCCRCTGSSRTYTGIRCRYAQFYKRHQSS